MKTCPNCGAPIVPYKHKCEYCGVIYFDFTSIDLEHDTPTYVSFRTPMGIITALTLPQFETMQYDTDYNYIQTPNGHPIAMYSRSKSCCLNVRFQCIDQQGSLVKLEIKDEKNGNIGNDD